MTRSLDYDMAFRISQNFDSGSERYLRSLVANVTGDGEYADSLGYFDLRREARRIKREADRVLEARNLRQVLEREVESPRENTAGKQLMLFG